MDTAHAPDSVPDFFGLEARHDPHGHIEGLRSTKPLCPRDDGHVYVVTSYEGVSEICRQPNLFSNEKAPQVNAMIRAGLLEVDPDVAAVGAQVVVTDPALQFADPPRHTQSRKTVSRWFTARRVNEDWRPVIERNVAAIFDRIVPGDVVDVMVALATPLPIRVIADILGIDSARDADLKRWSDEVSGLGRKRSKAEAIAQASANVELLKFISDSLRDRLATPRDDLLSHLAALTIDQPESGEADLERLTFAEATSIVWQLIIAGNETTTQLLGELVSLLAENPDQMSLIRRDRSLVPNAIDEVLRLRPPVRGLFRIPSENAELCDVRLPKGSLVATMFAGANHDPAVYLDPLVYTADRDNANTHLSFGAGVHFCLGASLAKSEASTFLNRLLDEYEQIELLPPAPNDVAGSIMMAGRRHLRAVFHTSRTRP